MAFEIRVNCCTQKQISTKKIAELSKDLSELEQEIITGLGEVKLNQLSVLENQRLQKNWNSSNFRVDMGDLPCSRIY